MGLNSILKECRDFITDISGLGSTTGWYGGGGSSSAGITVTEAGSLQSPVWFGCIRIISAIIAKTDLHVFEYLPTGGRRIATDHPLEHLLNVAPNDEMDAYIAKETSQVHLLTNGNAYYKITRDRNRRVTELYPLSPFVTYPYRDDKTRQIVYQWTDVNGTTLILSADEVLHIKNVSWEGLVGMSPIRQYAKETLGLDIGLRTYGSKYIANGASASMALTFKGKLTPEDRKKYEADIKQAHSGANAHRAFVLDQAADLKNMAISPEEAQFLETRGFQRDEITACIFGVPSFLVGGKEDSTAGISEQNSGLFQNTISAWTGRWTSAMNAKFFTNKPKTKWEDSSKYVIDFDTSDLRRYALVELLKTIATGRQWGVLTIKESREMMRMNPYDTADDKDYVDQLMRPVNMIPLTNDPPPQPALTDGKDPVKPPEPDHAAGAQVVEDVARNLFNGVFVDAFKRVLSRDNRDARVVTNAFTAPLAAIADYFFMTLDENHRSGDSLSNQITEFMSGYMGAMAQRASSWTNDHAGTEFSRAVTELRTKIEQENLNGTSD